MGNSDSSDTEQTIEHSLVLSLSTPQKQESDEIATVTVVSNLISSTVMQKSREIEELWKSLQHKQVDEKKEMKQ